MVVLSSCEEDADDLHLPYAITSAAIEYYSDYVEGFRDKPNKPCYISVWLEYTAVIERCAEPVNEEDGCAAAYVVKMELYLGFNCGFLCGHGFSARREVALSREGVVAWILWDGPVGFWVS